MNLLDTASVAFLDSVAASFSRKSLCKRRLMMSPHLTKSLIALLVALSAASVFAQMAIPYGLPVGVENARKAATAALAEARKNNWTMAVAIVDPSGNLVYTKRWIIPSSAALWL